MRQAPANPDGAPAQPPANAGIARTKEAIARDGHFTSKAGKMCQRLGRPDADPKVEAARRELANGNGILMTARLVGLGTGTVQRLKRDMAVATW